MRTPVAVTVPDGLWARELEDRLRQLGPTVVERDGNWSVELETGDDATLAQLLSAVDDWLAQAGPESVRVNVDGREYVMERAAHQRVSAEQPADMLGSRLRSSPV